MGRVIAVTGRGGTGKTTVSANVAYALANRGKKTLLIDCDCGMRSQDVVFGFQDSVVYNFYDAALERCEAADACFKTENGLKIMAAPADISCDELDFEKVKTFLKKTKSAYDFVILDCTASLCRGLSEFVSMSDTVIVISECNLRCAHAAEMLAVTAQKKQINEIYLVINKFFVDKSEKNGIIDSEELLQITALTPIGVCPSEKNEGLAVKNKKSQLGKACTNIAARLLGEKVPVLYSDRRWIFR